MDDMKPTYVEGKGVRIGFFYEYLPEAVEFDTLAETIAHCIGEVTEGLQQLIPVVLMKWPQLDQDQKLGDITFEHRPSSNITYAKTWLFEGGYMKPEPSR